MERRSCLLNKFTLNWPEDWFNARFLKWLPLNEMHILILDNLHCIQQGVDLLDRLDVDLYTRPSPQCFDSKIGGHLRHNIDHYSSLLKGCRSGRVDYDERPRDERVENDPDHAVRALNRIAGELGKIESEDMDKDLLVKMDSGSPESRKSWSKSTIRRELQFLLSHTIHHYALIAVICNLHGIKTPSDFGVAPSTLKHQQTQAQCAP